MERSTNYRELRRFCERENYHSSRGGNANNGSMLSNSSRQATTHSQICYTDDGKITIYKYIEKGRKQKNTNKNQKGSSSSTNNFQEK